MQFIELSSATFRPWSLSLPLCCWALCFLLLALCSVCARVLSSSCGCQWQPGTLWDRQIFWTGSRDFAFSFFYVAASLCPACPANTTSIPSLWMARVNWFYCPTSNFFLRLSIKLIKCDCRLATCTTSKTVPKETIFLILINFRHEPAKPIRIRNNFHTKFKKA